MHNQGVIARSTFGSVDALDGRAAGGVGTQTVDGFCGECDGDVGCAQVVSCFAEGRQNVVLF